MAHFCILLTSLGECRDINSLPWHNKGISHTKLQSYMSWVPLVGSGLGSMVGGHLSDILSRNTKKGWTFGRAGRPIVAGTSALVSTPFILLALFAGYPGCFLYFIPSGFVSLLDSSFLIFCRLVRCILGHPWLFCQTLLLWILSSPLWHYLCLLSL